MRIALRTALWLEPLLLPSFGSKFKTVKFRGSWSPAKILFRTITLGFQSCRAMATSPTCHTVKEKIELSETEKKIFDRLIGTLRHFGLHNQLRVAGGWVRDKLLGKECYDIDIALDNMMGSEFVDKVKEYLLSMREEVQGIAVIPCNPDQSKHLETARMRLFNSWVDFVNLRCEEYCKNSRIPTNKKFGTAEEDAYRRDLTINSLFYNINIDSVEDFTKRGARFEFTLDEELKEAAASDDVKAALAAKISRERIGTEIDLMISGNQPVKAMTFICDLTLFWIVFNLPPNFEPAITDVFDRLCLEFLNTAWNLIQSIGYSTFGDEQKRLSLYSSLFLPFKKTTYNDKKTKKISVVNYIFRESLKRKASDAEMVIDIHRASLRFLDLIPYLASKGNDQLVEVKWIKGLDDVPVSARLRVATGFLLREIREFWRVSLLISILLYPIDINHTGDKHFHLYKQRDLFKSVEDSIVTLGLEKVWDAKQWINGKDVMNVFQLKAGGPLVKEGLEKAMAWQLAHPSGTAEDCLDWLKQSYSKRAKLE